MDSPSKSPRFNPAVLPLEYMPRITDVGDWNYTKHYLIPGKVFVSPEKFAITTLVGSGVAVSLWDSARRIGGMNHFLLPEGPASDANGTRYANIANEALLQQLLKLGADTKQLVARIFGGSQPTVTFGNTKECLGDRNVQVATHFLGMKGIRIVQSEIGGKQGRKVIFHTDDGQGWAQQL